MNKIQLMKQQDTNLKDLALENHSSWIDFHQELIQRRIDAGLTQADVAKQIGISQSAVSQFETLTSLPNLQTVLTYALVVGARLEFAVADASD